jgi:hypothetical protein
MNPGAVRQVFGHQKLRQIVLSSPKPNFFKIALVTEILIDESV